MSSFDDFLKNIRPDDALKQACKEAHHRLRQRVKDNQETNDITWLQFLQGSYSRHTLVKPQPGKKADVDLVVVTYIPDHLPVQKAVGPFKRLAEQHYPDWREQGRSIGLVDGDVELDLVVTAHPRVMDHSLSPMEFKAAMAANARLEEVDLGDEEDLLTFLRTLRSYGADDEPLRIPDQKYEEWDDTHPAKQLEHHRRRQRQTNGLLIDVVRALKWWKYRLHHEHPDLMPKYPKGFPLERLIEYYLPDDVENVEQGIVRVLESWIEELKPDVDADTLPYVEDTGLKRNILSFVPLDDLRIFLQRAAEALPVAQDAYDHRESDPGYAATQWYRIFGDEFPIPVEGQPNNDEHPPVQRFTEDPPRSRARAVQPGSFA